MKPRPNLLAGEDLPPQPLQKRSLDKRERLKTASRALFGERGYEHTSIDDIAARAGLAVGGFYQHYRSKRQLLLALMDDLLEKLSQVNFQPPAGAGLRPMIQELLSRAFAHDLRYLGAYRAWQEAVLSDRELARHEVEIRIWTTARVYALLQRLHQLPGARKNVDLPAVAHAMDNFFWTLLAQARRMPKSELHRSVDTATHLICHAIFTDAALKER